MRPRAVVIDSIQTVYLDDVSGSAGSVSQGRAWGKDLTLESFQILTEIVFGSQPV